MGNIVAVPDETNTDNSPAVRPEVDVHIGTINEQIPVAGDGDSFSVEISKARTLVGVNEATKKRATRQLSKVARNADGSAGTKQEYEEQGSGYQLFDVVMPPYNLEYLAKIYELSAPHYAAVNVKVANIVGLGYDFVETAKTREIIDKNDGAKLKRTRSTLQRLKQTLMDMVDSWNDEDTFTETLMKAWTDYESTGNGYIEVGRKNTGEIGYVGHVPSTTIRVRKKRDGYVQIVSNKTIFFRNFGDTGTSNPVGNDSRPNELIHIKNYSPATQYYGVPDIVAAKTAIAGNEFASRYNLDYFENKAVPRYIIVIKGATLSATAERRILEFFQTNVKGKNHRTLYVPLPGDNPMGEKVEFKMEPVEAGVQDSSFNNYRKGNLSEILMVNGVPLSKVANAESISLAAARDADKTFKETVARPRQAIFEKKINRIFKEVTDVFLLKLNELTLTDEDTQSKIDERGIRNQWLTPNEVRSRKGMAGLESGDKVVPTTADVSAQAKAQQQGTSARAQDRSANATDSAGNARNPKGEGRTTA